MILDDVDILIDFWDLFVLVKKSYFKTRFPSHIRTIEAFGCENSLDNVVISVKITNFSVDRGDMNLKNIVFSDTWH